MSEDYPARSFLEIQCQRCAATAMDGPMFPGRVAGEWLCEAHADDANGETVPAE